jgi:hypothetical protein
LLDVRADGIRAALCGRRLDRLTIRRPGTARTEHGADDEARDGQATSSAEGLPAGLARSGRSHSPLTLLRLRPLFDGATAQHTTRRDATATAQLPHNCRTSMTLVEPGSP